MYVMSGHDAETVQEEIQVCVKNAETKMEKLTCDDCRERLHCMESDRKYICKSFRYFEWSGNRADKSMNRRDDISEGKHKGKIQSG